MPARRHLHADRRSPHEPNVREVSSSECPLLRRSRTHDSRSTTLNDGMKRSLLGGLAATVAVAGTALTSAPALASPPDPSSTDIPSLGWRGENLRFVVCDPTLTAARTVGFSVQDWSGDPLHQPAL